MTLDEAKDRIINLFTELKAEGVDTRVEQVWGEWGLWLSTLSTSHDGVDQLELTNRDWHPEWAK
jgi:subtilisin-like proprotein convertase family protein